jgi:hypothetical protein
MRNWLMALAAVVAVPPRPISPALAANDACHV